MNTAQNTITASKTATRRERRCSRCRRLMLDEGRDRLCTDCYLATCPCCVECGEPLLEDLDTDGVCYRCRPDSDYWLQRHMEPEEDW